MKEKKNTLLILSTLAFIAALSTVYAEDNKKENSTAETKEAVAATDEKKVKCKERKETSADKNDTKEKTTTSDDKASDSDKKVKESNMAETKKDANTKTATAASSEKTTENAEKKNAEMKGTPSPEGASAYIITPMDGDEVSSPVHIVFGLTGMGVAPAGVATANTGHHHLMIDMDSLPEAGIPMGGNVKHFGGGQTETQVELEPGKHTLQLMLGDQLHIPFVPPVMSEKITITVTK